MPWSFSFGCIGTVPDDGKEEGWPAAVSSAENFAKFDLPPEANKPKSNFAKISVESYPFRGWPQKQAVLYKVGINGNGPGGTGGDARPGVLICCLFFQCCDTLVDAPSPIGPPAIAFATLPARSSCRALGLSMSS
jgi:hypothetical protein